MFLWHEGRLRQIKAFSETYFPADFFSFRSFSGGGYKRKTDDYNGGSRGKSGRWDQAGSGGYASNGGGYSNSYNTRSYDKY